MAIPEKAYANDVKDLHGLIKSCGFKDALFLAERLPQHVVTDPEERQNLLCFTLFHEDIPFATYTAGRIFNEDFELRWERIDDKTVRAVYIGQKRSIPTLDFVHDVQRQEESKYYYLFGKRLDKEELDLIGPSAQSGDFAEVRIPRLLRYPPLSQQAERVLLGVYECEYMQEKTGEKVKLFRFHNLKPAR